MFSPNSNVVYKYDNKGWPGFLLGNIDNVVNPDVWN